MLCTFFRQEVNPLCLSLATKQKQFFGAWRNYRSGAAVENNGEDNEKGQKETSNSDKEKVRLFFTSVYCPCLVYCVIPLPFVKSCLICRDVKKVHVVLMHTPPNRGYVLLENLRYTNGLDRLPKKKKTKIKNMMIQKFLNCVWTNFCV